MARAITSKETLPGLNRILRRFWPYVRKEKRLIGGSTAALFAELALRALEPWPLKFVFDHVLSTYSHKKELLAPLVNTIAPTNLLTISVLALVTIVSLRSLAAYGNTIGFALIGSRVLTAVRSDVYSHLQCLSLSFHAKARSGDLVVRVISDIGLLRDVIVTALLPLLANVLILVGMVGLMLWLNWQLALIALSLVPFFWITTLRMSRSIQVVSREQRQSEGVMAATAAESIGSIKTVQALSLENNFNQSFTRENQGNLREGIKAKRLEASLERTVDVLIAISTAVTLWFGARLVLRHALTPGELLVFLTYLKNTFNPLQDFAKYTSRLARASAAGERVLDILETTPEVRDLPGAKPAGPFQGAVEFDHVSFAYEADQWVLEDINFSVHPGQRVALVGPSGMGKSTLASLMLRLYNPGKGGISIDGQEIRAYTLDSLRAQISVVLQESLLFASTVRDNIAYGTAADSTLEEIEAAARLANAHDFIKALPLGYDTVLGERGVTISGGQRQRIAIARAAIRNAPILILDEPTAGLDDENERAVMSALENLTHGHTTFLITHDMALAARSDLILYFQGGRIKEQGTHEELFALGGAYATSYSMATSPHKHLSRGGDMKDGTTHNGTTTLPQDSHAFIN